jgi:phosphoribosylaminoimidazole carboxylase
LNQRGIPVATVAINNSTNAALLALRFLGGSNPEILDLMENYLASLKEEVGQKINKMERIGWQNYLAKK